jgi:hypothetical protein
VTLEQRLSGFRALCVLALLWLPQNPAILPIFVDYDAAPPTLSELSAASDAVVVVRVEAIRFESVPDSISRRPTDVTKYTLRLLDVLKSHPKLSPIGGIMELPRKGGQHVENGIVIRSAVRGFEDFVANHDYVLFLSWNSRTSSFDVAYGPTGAYELQASGGVRALAQTPIALRQQGKLRDAFLLELGR